RTPFTEPETGAGWEDDPDHPRSADELEWALESTFAIVRDCLDRWTVDDLTRAADRTVRGVTVTHTRASVLNRLCSHDAFHAGEISQLLGLHALPTIDLWRRPTP
ncbi:MAG: DinB 2 protein, partial [Chloroflexota bacterium]|nr:DinB 2 protein [Chloroflexota bacterium]